MNKILTVVLAVLMIGLIGCASSPKKSDKPKGEIKVETKVYPPKVVEHKNTAFGGEVPEWVFQEADELEKQDKYKGAYVFKFDQTGESLDGVQAWTRSFVAATEVARMVSIRVTNKFAGALVGDKDKVETYMEEVAKVLAQAQYAGARKVGDFWVHQQTYKSDGKPDKLIYRYLLLYSVPKEQIDAAIARALDEQAGKNKPKSEEEQTARDRVKELFKEGM